MLSVSRPPQPTFYPLRLLTALRLAEVLYFYYSIADTTVLLVSNDAYHTNRVEETDGLLVPHASNSAK